jgi:hypothetical protein
MTRPSPIVGVSEVEACDTDTAQVLCSQLYGEARISFARTADPLRWRLRREVLGSGTFIAAHQNLAGDPVFIPR